MECSDRISHGRASPSISLLVPAYNEEATVSRVIREAISAVSAVTNDFEAVLLDDGSSDKTLAMLEAIRNEEPGRIRVLRHTRNLGIAASFEALYRSATKDYVYLVPADGEFPADAIRTVVPLLGQYEVVVCSRVKKPYGAWRSAISYAFRVLPRLLFRVECYDAGSVKVMKREVVQNISVRSRSPFAEAERLIRAAKRGYRIGTVGIVQVRRQFGKPHGAKVTLVLHALYDLFALWFRLAILHEKP